MKEKESCIQKHYGKYTVALVFMQTPQPNTMKQVCEMIMQTFEERVGGGDTLAQ